MAEVVDIKVVKEAASKELQLARRRIVELETQVKAHAASSRWLPWVYRLVLLALVLAGASAAAHRLLLWGWP